MDSRLGCPSPGSECRPVSRHGLDRGCGWRTTAVLAVCLVVLSLVAGPAAAAEPRTYTPMDFGAAGDGSTDDTLALQQALDSLAPGDTLVIPGGRSFLHSDVLAVRVPGVRLTGAGTLVATNEARSAVVLDADDVQVDGITLRMESTSRRWVAFEQMKLRLGSHTGITVRSVAIDGAAAFGVYVGTGAADFLVEDVRVRDSRADGIHVTGGAHDGVVRRPDVSGTGDDGVAVVSYERDGSPVRRVRIEDATVGANSWGRGISVVGGEDITITGGAVHGSSSAGLYVASEGAPWFTFAPRRVSVTGLSIDAANTDTSIEHGAVLLYAGRPEQPVTGIDLSRLTITRTTAGAAWHVGVVAEPGAWVDDVTFSDVSISGPGEPFAANVDPGCCARLRWTVDGSPVADVGPAD